MPLIARGAWAIAAVCSLTIIILPGMVLGQLSDTNQAIAPVQISAFVVDGQPQRPDSRLWTTAHLTPAEFAQIKPFRISTGKQHLQFTFGPTDASRKLPVRFRYRLEGYETNWHDIGGPMRFVVHFRDAQAVPVGSADFSVVGDSPGWGGSIKASKFTQRQETVEVPERSHDARIWIPSGGNPDTVGVMVVEDIQVTRLAQADGAEIVLFSENFEQGRDLDNPLGDLEGWVRDGTSLAIAQITRAGHGANEHALALIDDNPEKFAAWDADAKKLIRVQPGEKLLFEWKEMYSVGGNAIANVSYRNLPAGDYRFVVNVVSPFGEFITEGRSVSFRITPPFYQHAWFQVGTTFLAVSLLLVGVRRAAKRRYQRQLERLEFEHLVEKERTRIAQDIHDDLGTKLTSVSLLSEAVRRDVGPASAFAPRLEEISATAKEITRAMDEIVWAVDPRQDTLESLISYLTTTAQDLLQMAGIRCRLSFPDKLPSLILFSDVRHNLFLAFCEVLNNVIKHAQASEVHLGLEFGPTEFILAITDNGRGFAPEKLPRPSDIVAVPRRLARNGLTNLKRRLEKIKGTVIIESRLGEGTKVVFQIPIQSANPHSGSKRPSDASRS